MSENEKNGQNSVGFFNRDVERVISGSKISPEFLNKVDSRQAGEELKSSLDAIVKAVSERS